jgi:hypothetical protein
MLLGRGIVLTSSAVLFTSAGGVADAHARSGLVRGSELLDASFDLTINKNQPGFITGTADGKRAFADGTLYASGPTTIKGSLAGLALDATLAQEDQVPHGNGYMATTKVTGSVGDAKSTLLV